MTLAKTPRAAATVQTRQRFLVGAVIVAATLASVNSTFANTVNGSIWEVSPALAGDAEPSSLIGLGTPDATFTAPSDPLSFTSGGAYTIGEFLASGSATNIVYNGTAASTDTLDNTLFNFTGTVSVTNGETFTAGHDDGLTLIIGGVTVISATGPTSFDLTTATYTGPTGNESFQLVYGECCGAPAVLNVDLPLSSGVPEPLTWSMMLLGVGGIGGMLRRRTHQIAAVA